MINTKKVQTVAVLGASDKPNRFAYKAIIKLQQYGHKVIPVHPKLETINNLQVVPNLKAINEPIDTLTLYIGAQRSEPIVDDIISVKPGRVIFNPGTESEFLQKRLTEAKIDYLEGCTLIMLDTDTFDLNAT